MPTTELMRVLTDPALRDDLTATGLERLPEHPAGDIDAELDQLLVHASLTTCGTGATLYSGGGPACCC